MKGAAALLLAGLALLFALAVASWTGHGPLDLAAPGPGAGARLVAFGRDFPACRAALDRAGVRYAVLPARHEGPACGYDDGVRFAAGGSRGVAYDPANVGVACTVAAGLAAWEWDVVQPAALRSLGAPVVAIEHFDSYNCRHIRGVAAGGWSEHAHADAIDVAGFRFADGRRVTVAADWRDAGPAASFLHRVRDGACPLFATVLSPDYNAAHRDHLHLDQASRGGWGWRACR